MKILFPLLLVTASFSEAADPPLCPGAWTLVHIPDTQNYVSDAGRTAILNAELDWIAARRATRNIRFAVQVGDLTNDNGDLQWSRAGEAFDRLAGVVPFAACTGNHDCGPGGSGDTRTTQFSLASRFGSGSPYGQQSTLGGWFQHPDDAPGNTQNSWHTFRVDRQDYLVLTCEWGPRDAVVTWMDQVAASHPWHRIILVCHAYLESGSGRFDWSSSQSSMNPHSFGIASGSAGVNDGQELWDKLIKKFENFCLVCCGHTGVGFRTVTGTHGNRVHEMLYNTQDLANGGNGWLRLLEFYPDNRTVQARTFSTHLGTWDENSSRSFRFTLSPVSRVDSDSDGMPDYFEVQHGWNTQSPANAAADSDQDGVSNLEEYLSSTSPLNSASLLRITDVSKTPSSLTLTWESVPGIKYQVEESSSPGGGTWTPSGPEVSAADFTSSATLATAGTRRFFRIRAVPE